MRVLIRHAAAVQRGFTLVEILIVLAILAVLTALALPSFEQYLKKSRAKGAAADLVTWSLAMENRFQKQLLYPVYTAAAVPAALAERQGTQATDFGAWVPSQGDHFTYSITSTASTYTLQAVGKGASWCTLTLTQNNVRSTTGCTSLGAW